MTLACVVFARRYAALRERGWAAYSVATATAALILSMWPSREGASVRFFLASVIVWAWTSAVAARLRLQVTRSTVGEEIGLMPRSNLVRDRSQEEVGA
jgi:hypothetical protein